MYSPEPSVFSIGGMDQVPRWVPGNQSLLLLLLSSKLRRRQDKPRFELSNMGLPSTSTNCPELGCDAGYRVPRQGISHKDSPTGRATGSVMLLGDGAMLCCHLSRPCSFPPGIQSSTILLPQQKYDGLPQNTVLWRFCLSIVVAVSKIQDPVSVLFLNLRCQGRCVYSRIMWTSDLGRRMHRHQRDERSPPAP